MRLQEYYFQTFLYEALIPNMVESFLNIHENCYRVEVVIRVSVYAKINLD